MDWAKNKNQLITDYLQKFSIYYPDILEWYKKVETEISSGKRDIFVCAENGIIKGLAITKNQKDAKLCHISVLEEYQQNNVGIFLMRKAVQEMFSRGASSVCVTTGEETYQKHGDFFRRCGFSLLKAQKNRYRKDVDELIWTADRQILRNYLDL